MKAPSTCWLGAGIETATVSAPSTGVKGFLGSAHEVIGSTSGTFSPRAATSSTGHFLYSGITLLRLRDSDTFGVEPARGFTEVQSGATFRGRMRGAHP